jgi:hypothetical protein
MVADFRQRVAGLRRSQWPAWSRVRILSAPTPSRADKPSILISILTLGELSIEKLSGGPDLFAGVRNRGPLLRGKRVPASTDLG